MPPAPRREADEETESTLALLGRWKIDLDRRSPRSLAQISLFPNAGIRPSGPQIGLQPHRGTSLYFPSGSGIRTQRRVRTRLPAPPIRTADAETSCRHSGSVSEIPAIPRGLGRWASAYPNRRLWVPRPIGPHQRLSLSPSWAVRIRSRFAGEVPAICGSWARACDPLSCTRLGTFLIRRADSAVEPVPELTYPPTAKSASRRNPGAPGARSPAPAKIFGGVVHGLDRQPMTLRVRPLGLARCRALIQVHEPLAVSTRQLARDSLPALRSRHLDPQWNGEPSIAESVRVYGSLADSEPGWLEILQRTLDTVFGHFLKNTPIAPAGSRPKAIDLASELRHSGSAASPDERADRQNGGGREQREGDVVRLEQVEKAGRLRRPVSGVCAGERCDETEHTDRRSDPEFWHDFVSQSMISTQDSLSKRQSTGAWAAKSY